MNRKAIELSPGEIIGSAGVGIGYPSTDVPRPVRSAAIDALERKQTHYASVPGVDPLRQAVAGFMSDLGVDVPVEQVIVTGSGQEARFLALQGMIRPYSDTLFARGDRKARYLAVYDVVEQTLPVAIPAVVAPGARAALAVRERRVATMPVDRSAGLLSSVDGVEQALEGGSRLIYLESPSQLTGFTYTPEQIERIAGLLEAHDALCVWDQSTAPAVVGEYASLAAVAAERTATIGELWPGLGLESWRIGYVTAPAACVEGLVALKQVLSICTSTPVQWAAVGAAEVFGERHNSLVAAMDSTRRDVLEAVAGDERVLVGEAVNVLALNLGDGAAMALQRLSDAGVEAVDGASFGAPDIVRVAISPDERVTEAVHSVLRGVSS